MGDILDSGLLFYCIFPIFHLMNQERMSISDPTLIRAASQFRNKGWKLLEKVTRVIEGPANEPQEEVVVRRPKPKLIPEVVVSIRNRVLP